MNDVNTILDNARTSPEAALTTSETTIYKDRKAAAVATQPGERCIAISLKNPARQFAINIPATPWQELASDNVPPQYIELLGAVLDKAAKDILKSYLISFSVVPSTISIASFCKTALLDMATGASSDWLTKDELIAGWERSATRKQWITDARYATNKTFRATVNYFADCYNKLAAKNVQLSDADLNVLITRVHADDMETDWGLFVLRRLTAIQQRPEAVTGIDTSMI